MTGRIPIVGGNWKMHTTRTEARALLGELYDALDQVTGVEVVVFPPYPWLGDAADLLAGSRVGVGAQDLFWEARGAFTGAVSGPMLIGTATQVIVGHSERRHRFGDGDEDVRRKLHAALDAHLAPVLAVGERLEEREAGATIEVLRRQLLTATEGLPALPPSLVIAYEPVWAIGAGLSATPEQAQAGCAEVRAILAARFTSQAAATCRIQYGGSVTAENVAALAAQPDIDGALVGGASLDAAAFAAICRAVAASKAA